MRICLPLGFLLCLASIGNGPARAEPDPKKPGNASEAAEKFVKSFSEPIRIEASHAVSVNDAQFVLRRMGNTLVFYAWSPSATPDPTAAMVAATLSTLVEAVPAP